MKNIYQEIKNKFTNHQSLEGIDSDQLWSKIEADLEPAPKGGFYLYSLGALLGLVALMGIAWFSFGSEKNAVQVASNEKQSTLIESTIEKQQEKVVNKNKLTNTESTFLIQEESVIINNKIAADIKQNTYSENISENRNSKQEEPSKIGDFENEQSSKVVAEAEIATKQTDSKELFTTRDKKAALQAHSEQIENNDLSLLINDSDLANEKGGEGLYTSASTSVNTKDDVFVPVTELSDPAVETASSQELPKKSKITDFDRTQVTDSSKDLDVSIPNNTAMLNVVEDLEEIGKEREQNPNGTAVNEIVEVQTGNPISEAVDVPEDVNNNLLINDDENNKQEKSKKATDVKEEGLMTDAQEDSAEEINTFSDSNTSKKQAKELETDREISKEKESSIAEKKSDAQTGKGKKNRNPIELPALNLSKWQLGFSTGLASWQTSFSDPLGESLAFEEQVNLAHQTDIGYAANFRITYEINEHWQINSGLDYYALNSLLSLQIVSDSTFMNMEMGTEEWVDGIAIRTIKHHNDLNFFSIPLSITYLQTKPKFSYGMTAGLAYNFVLSQSGRSLSALDSPTIYDNESSVLPHRSAFISLFLEPFARLPLNEKIDLQLGFNLAQQWDGNTTYNGLKGRSLKMGVHSGLIFKF